MYDLCIIKINYIRHNCVLFHYLNATYFKIPFILKHKYLQPHAIINDTKERFSAEMLVEGCQFF